jgi:RNA polymerase sigma factor (sigma-70 family)
VPEDLSNEEGTGRRDRREGIRVEGVNEGLAAAVHPMTLEEFELFYATEYPKLVKILRLLDATFEEAEDAAQKAMADFFRRSKSAKAPNHPVTYVQRAAIHFFFKERQRDRERLPRELRGGHLVTETYLDDRLTDWENEQHIEPILGCLTPTQRQVIKLVMDGLSTHEIAVQLGKTDENVRQQLKKGRYRLKAHPDMPPFAPRHDQGPGQRGVRSTVTTPEPRKEEVQ